MKLMMNLEHPLNDHLQGLNFPNDTENEDDYAIGWEWHEVDPGPLTALYNGFQQCLLDPT